MTSAVISNDRQSFDAREFRRALGCFPTGVAIITTRDTDGSPVGLTCNSFSSVSLEPPLVLWSLRRNSRSLDAFRRARAFAISILAEGQRDLSNRFASSIEKKFEGMNHGEEKLPLVDGSIARFCCKTVEEHEAGDHVVFIGEVESFEYREQDPLVFYRGAYMMIAESLRDLFSKGQGTTSALNEARENVYGILFRMATERATAEDLEQIECKLREIDAFAKAGEMQQRAEAALDFFHLIGAAAHNPVLAIVEQSLGNLMKQQVSASATAMNWSELHKPELTPIRWRILDRLRQKDAGGAVAALSEYVRVSPLASWSAMSAS